MQIGANAKVPNPNDVHNNYAQAWSWAHTKDTFGTLNGEYDLSDSVMLYGGVGLRQSNHDFLRHAVSITNNAGDFSVFSPVTKTSAPPRRVSAAGSIPAR